MQKIAILYDASQAVMSTFELDEVLQRILSILRDYFQIQNAAVMLLDPKTGDLIVRSEFGRKRTHNRIPRGAGITGAALRMKRPVYVADVSHDPRYLPGFPNTRSELSVPLIVRDEVVGVLDMQSDVIDFFDSETIDLLTLFSTQASIALENARLYSMEQRRAKQLEAINAIARQTTALVELDHLLDLVCTLMLERFPVDQVAVLLSDEDGRLYVSANFGKLTPVLPQGEPVKGGGLASKALSLAQTVVCNNVAEDPDYIPGCRETQSEMCVPLMFFGEKLGVLALDNALPDAFDPGDVQPLESVADICAAAIANARHFERTQQLAYLDGLTSVFNRRFFEMRIREELERALRYNTSLSVIMLDIDYFKKLNDEFGHLLGDEVLRQISSIFQQHLRKGDVVCRFGGEEFALLLPQTNGENAFEVAEKLRRTVELHHFPGVPRPVTISAGVAAHPECGKNRDEIVSAADAALYQAKMTGRNRVISAEKARASVAKKS
jgi:diguanylate cyclase (GGDEF)-like protein